MRLAPLANDTATTMLICVWFLVCLSSVVTGRDNQANCGRANRPASRSRRIVGGVKSDPCEFPWLVLVKNENGDQCGGSLIDHRHVLTAAHCFMHNPDARVFVAAGSSRMDNLKRLDVKSVKIHPLWDPRTSDFDIAVLTLKHPVEYSSCLSPICLPTPESIPSEDDHCQSAGWGHNENKEISFHQRKVSLPLVRLGVCAMVYKGRIDKTKLCAGDIFNGGVDTCQGDSGGPLMCGKEGGHFVQYGIVSFGHGCGVPSFPGVYTRVNHPAVLGFILAAVQDG